MQPFTDLNEIKNLSRADFESACKANTSYIYMGNSVGLCQILTRHRVFVDTRDFLERAVSATTKPLDCRFDVNFNNLESSGLGSTAIVLPPSPAS